jgi:hypothetical protein
MAGVKRRPTRLPVSPLLDLRASGARSNMPLPSDAVRCEVCGGHFVALATHLARKHGVTGKQYRERFPGALLQVRGLSEDQAERALLHFHGLTKRKWTRERVIRALQREMRRGRYPYSWRPATSYRPDAQTMTNLFGSHSAALEAAGITLRRNAATGMRVKLREPASEGWVEAYERGDRVRDIASRAGVSKDTVRRRLRVAGVEPRPIGRPAAAQVERVCETCGATFGAKRSEVWRGGGQFCSRECVRHPERWLKVELVCEVCEGMFEVTSGQAEAGRRFCSQSCANRAPERRMPRVELVCETCGEAFEVAPWEARRRRFCSVGCVR